MPDALPPPSPSRGEGNDPLTGRLAVSVKVACRG